MDKLTHCFASTWWHDYFWWILVSSLVLLGVLIYVFRYAIFERLPVWLFSNTLYRVHVHGHENIPKDGAVLFVSNHVSHIDAGLVTAAARRPVRFLIWAPFLKVPILGSILKVARVIPIMGTSGPRAIIKSLRTASEALERGETVCIFAEGGITRTGFLLPFHRGLEQIVKRSPTPIIPVYLDHVWGSVFSYQRGRFFWKWPKSIPYQVYVSFGKPIQPETPAWEVRRAIQLLSAESAVRRADDRVPVHRQFIRVACRHPFRSCIIDPNNKSKPILKYGETLAAAKLMMSLLKPRLGDDHWVGIWMPPTAGGALANLVVSFLGKVSVNLNYSASPELVGSAIDQSGIRKILTSRLFVSKVPIDPGPKVELIYLEDLRKEITSRQRLLAFLSVLLMPRFIQERIIGVHKHTTTDLATVIFSSGSTGEPKGVVLTHSNVAANAESMIQAIDLRPSDRLVGILPFFHSFGYTVTFWGPLQVGASVVFYPNPLQAKEIGSLIRQYKGTIFLSTPTFLRNFLRKCEADDFLSLRLLVCGAEKLPQALAKEFHDKFRVQPYEGYGCTECSPVVAANVPDYETDGLKQTGNKPGTIGQALPGIATKVVDRSRREELPPDNEGLLLVYGANIMKGYLNRDELTQDKMHDGWYITGDLAIMDEDGFVTITGREERFAKIGGEMVPLERIEEELHHVLDTNDRVFAVTSIADERKGERIIVLHLPVEVELEKLRHGLSERGLPNIYIPGNRDFYQVPELPVLGSGKLDIKKCRQQAEELAGIRSV